MGWFDGLLQDAGKVAQSGYNTFVKPTVDTVSQLPSNLYHVGNAVGMVGSSMLQNQRGADLAAQKQRIIDEMNQTWFKNSFQNQQHINDTSSGDALRQIAGTGAEKALNVASLLPVGKGLQAAETVLKNPITRDALIQSIKSGAISGAKMNAGFGAAGGAAQSMQQDHMSAGDLAKNTAIGAGTGAVTGAALGAGGALVGAGAKAASHGVTSMIQSMLDKQGTNLRNLYVIHAMQHLPEDMPPSQPSQAPTKIPVVGADLVPHQVPVSTEAHAIPNLEGQVASHPNATPHELTAMQAFKQAGNLNDQQYHQLLSNRLDDLNKGGISHLSTQTPIERPIAPTGTNGRVPIKELSALDHHTANAQDLIAHQHANPPLGQNEANANKLLAQKQAESEAAKMQTTPTGAIRGGGLKPVEMPGMDKYRARAEAYKANEAKMSEAEMAAREANAPSPHEMKAMDANAAPPTPKVAAEPKIPTQPSQPVHPLLQEVLSGKAPKPEPMLAKETGSAHANQGDPMARPQSSSIPKDAQAAPARESAPPVVHRVKDENGDVKSIVHTQTGERVDVRHDGAPQSNFINEVLHEAQTNYGGKVRNAETVANEHGSNNGGRQGVLNIRLKAALDDYNGRLNADERNQITHLVEGTLKPEDVSAKVRQGAEQFKEIGRLNYLISKEGKQSMGEINNGTDNYVPHINKDASPRVKDDKAPLGAGKFSTKNDQQQQRIIAKFTGPSGRVQIGDPAKLNLTKLGDGKYMDKSGQTWHASNATVAEKNGAGMHYEEDSGKLLQHMMQNTAKTANNLKLGRNLTTTDHGKDIIPRMPGEKTPPKGYVESHIDDMQNHWMSKAYHDKMFTASDDTKGKIWKSAAFLSKYGPAGLINRGLYKAFFSQNSAFHQLINETGQALLTSGVGAGKAGNFVKQLMGGPVNAIKMSKELSAANKSVVAHDEHLLDFMRIGGHLSTDTSKGIPKVINGVINKLKATGQTMDVFGKFGHNMAIHIGDTIRVAKFNALVKDGMNPYEALRVVDESQGNNRNMSRFEKEILSNNVAFYPFFRNMQAKGLKNITYGAIKNPGVYAGSAAMAALTYAAYTAFTKGGQVAGGNDYFNIKKGGALGLIDDIAKAPGQIMGHTDKAGNKQPGTVPSVISNRLTPTERIAIEQLTGRSLATNKPFDTSAAGRLDTAANSLSQYKEYKDLQSGKKSLAEVAANLNGVTMSHGLNTPAMPNFNKGVMKPVGDLINVSGHDSKATIDAANAAKAEGGSKLASYQYARNSGDDSLASFWAKNPTLDPKSPQFKGYDSATGSEKITAGKNLIKANGGSSLAYMQALKASGSSQYDKFFKDNPQLDPTNPAYQKQPSNAQKSQARYAKSQAKYAARSTKFAMDKVKSITAKSIKGTATPHIPGMKTSFSLRAPKVSAGATKVKLAKVAPVPTAKIKLAKATTVPKAGVKLKLKA